MASPAAKRPRVELRSGEVSLPSPSSSSSKASSSYIFIVGGRDKGKTLGLSEYLDLQTQTFHRLPSLVEPRGSHAALAVGSLVYALGGGGMRSNLSSVEVLDASQIVRRAKSSSDIAADSAPPPVSWQSSPPLVGGPRHALSGVVCDGSLWAVGGWANGNEAVAVLEKYNPEAASWSAAYKPMRTARKLFGLTASDGKLYAFGGAGTDGGFLASSEVYDVEKDEWSDIAAIPHAAYSCASTTSNGSIFVFMQGKYVCRFDAEGNKYVKCADLPLKEWFGFSTVAVGEDIYVLGGQCVGAVKGFCYRFDTSSNTFHELPSMLRFRRRLGATLVTVENEEGGEDKCSESDSERVTIGDL